MPVLIVLPFYTFFPGEAGKGRGKQTESWACQHADIETVMFGVRGTDAAAVCQDQSS